MKSMQSRYNTIGYWSMPVRLEIRLLQNVSPRMYRYDVFYDRDLEGDVEL